MTTMLKRITGLDQIIKTISGLSIVIESDKPLSYKDAIVTLCEMHKSSVPGENLKVYSIGSRIYSAKDTIDLTVEEMSILKSLINESNVFIATIVGKLIEMINSAKDIKDK
jgi:hypothetical protein